MLVILNYLLFGFGGFVQGQENVLQYGGFAQRQESSPFADSLFNQYDDHNKEFEQYNDRRIEIVQYPSMRFAPQGDYSHLKLIVNTDHDRYYLGQPVFFQIVLENVSTDSSETISFNPNMSSSLFAFNQVELTDSSGNNVPLTLFGKKMKKRARLLRKGDIIDTPGASASVGQGEKFYIFDGKLRDLCMYYDLTLSGTYHLKISRTSVIEGQKYEEPLCSNTATFEITKSIPMIRSQGKSSTGL